PVQSRRVRPLLVHPWIDHSLNTLDASHVGFEYLGHQNTAVRLLVVLHHRNHGATYGQAGTIEGMDRFGLSGVRITPAGLHTPCLKITGVGTGRNFAVFALPRQPDFQIVGFGGGETYVAATEG